MHDRLSPVDGQTRYPGYDVLSKRNGPSWNEQTRRVIARRLSVGSEPRFFTASEFQTVTAVADRIVPQPPTRPPIPVAALVDEKLHRGVSDGYRLSTVPPDGALWRLGLKALDSEARMTHGDRFQFLSVARQQDLLEKMASGDLKRAEWEGVDPSDFFKKRMARDIVLAYYAHPTAWSEIGWGGPASPRGYVRLDFDERDPWEAAEADGHDDALVRRANRHVR